MVPKNQRNTGPGMQGPESVVVEKSGLQALSVGEPLDAVVEESPDVEAGSLAGCVARVMGWRVLDGWRYWGVGGCGCAGIVSVGAETEASTFGGESVLSALLTCICGTIVSNIVVIGFIFILFDTISG